METVRLLMEQAPFLIGTAGHIKMNTARVIEGLIIAGVAGLVAAFLVTVQVNQKLETEFSNLKEKVAEVQTTIDKLHPRK